MAGPMRHGPGAMAVGEKAKDFKGTMKKLLAYMRRYLPSIVIALLCAVGGTVFSIFGPKILGQATTPRPHCASMSYGDIMEITFAGTQKESDTERDFFRFLVREGIPVKVESNRTE